MEIREGRFVWADLTTPDCEIAAGFYGGLFGWEMDRSDTEMGTYYVAEVGDRELAGMMAQAPEQAGMPPMWNVYIGSKRLEDTLHRIEAYGGKTFAPPTPIPDGRIAVAADPTGAVFMLIETSDEGGFEAYGKPGAVCWAEVMTRDPASAIEFYTGVFGWEASTEPSRTAGEYTTFRFEGEPMVGLMTMPPMVPAEAPSFWQVYFYVEDIDDTMARAKDLGGSVIAPKMQIGDDTWFTVIADPHGGGFGVLAGEM